jgi:hypothetical protein
MPGSRFSSYGHRRHEQFLRQALETPYARDSHTPACETARPPRMRGSLRCKPCWRLICRSTRPCARDVGGWGATEQRTDLRQSKAAMPTRARHCRPSEVLAHRSHPRMNWPTWRAAVGQLPTLAGARAPTLERLLLLANGPSGLERSRPNSQEGGGILLVLRVFSGCWMALADRDGQCACQTMSRSK